jgi:glycerophosphoryl diester phosphodiesterase
MIIISHRGYWKDVIEKNQVNAFERSFQLGFGTETDVRDFNGNLVISHDIADDKALNFDDFLKIYNGKKTSGKLPLALNIKSDGLQKKIKESLELNHIHDYFVFDMSVPDTLGYQHHNLNYFVRYSEFENINTLYNQASGVWLDGFKEDLVNEELVKKFIADDKKVCIVSSELHKRPYKEMWASLRNYEKCLFESDNLILCTDLPEDAMEFFYGK